MVPRGDGHVAAGVQALGDRAARSILGRAAGIGGVQSEAVRVNPCDLIDLVIEAGHSRDAGQPNRVARLEAMAGRGHNRCVSSRNGAYGFGRSTNRPVCGGNGGGSGQGPAHRVGIIARVYAD